MVSCYAGDLVHVSIFAGPRANVIDEVFSLITKNVETSGLPNSNKLIRLLTPSDKSFFRGVYGKA